MHKFVILIAISAILSAFCVNEAEGAKQLVRVLNNERIPAVTENVTIDANSLKTKVDYSKWFTAPHSRIVINPNIPMRLPLAGGPAPSLPMNTAYYVGEKPVVLPCLWSWMPGTFESLRGDIIQRIVIDASPHSSNWSDEGAISNLDDGKLSVKVAPGHHFGCASYKVTANLDETPYIIVNVSDADRLWALKVNSGSDDVDTILVSDTNQTGDFIVDIKAATGWNGTKTFILRMFSSDGEGANTVFSDMRFIGMKEMLQKSTKMDTAWYPYKTVTKANIERSSLHVESSVCLPDESTISQSFTVRNGSAGILNLTGQFAEGDIRWDPGMKAVILTADKYSIAITASRQCRWVGTFPSWSSLLFGTDTKSVKPSVWALEFKNVKPGDSIVISASFKPDGGAASVDSARKNADITAFNRAMDLKQKEWNKRLSSIPHPLDFELKLTDKKGTTPDQIRNTYYRAWCFIISNILPSMPENNYPYPQFACGKASLWAEGHPKSRPSSQWESFIAMQLGAIIGPDTAWSAFEGMMSCVDADGSFGGEGLPARHMQTAWILYSQTSNAERLRAMYPAMKRLLMWKVSDPRWIFKGLTPPDMKDCEFVVHDLMDMSYAVRICDTLKMPDETSYWKSEIAKMADNYAKWFWDSPGSVPYRLYSGSTGQPLGPSNTWTLPGLVLPPDQLSTPQRESLLKLLRDSLNEDIPFLIPGLNKHATYNYTILGAYQYGEMTIAAKMAEAAMRSVTLAGEFAESYLSSYPATTEGVTPSVFGAANIIDASLWHNGVVIGDGLPIIANTGDAAGVEGFLVRGKPINIAWHNEDGTVEIWGKGIAILKLPEGFKADPSGNGAYVWRGKIARGKQVKLELN
ncbi:MAG: hypothetical protein ACYC0V_02125 [Armatimonadota bacterium]